VVSANFLEEFRKRIRFSPVRQDIAFLLRVRPGRRVYQSQSDFGESQETSRPTTASVNG